MTIKPIIKKVKQRFRPAEWSKNMLNTKEKRRRFLYGAGAIIILALLVSLVMAINKQNDLQTKQLNLEKTLQSNQVELQKNQKQLKGLEANVNEKQKEIEKNAQTIKDKDKKQAELEEKIEQLTKQITILKSYGSGIGGNVHTAGSNVNVVAGNAYGYGYCTWYVKNMRPDIGSYWGNANQWYASAQAAGFDTGKQAKPGAIGVSFEGAAGHVVYVKSVSNGTIRLSEMNGAAGWNVVDERDAPESSFVYIYWKA